jgi:hypothetical protein
MTEKTTHYEAPAEGVKEVSATAQTYFAIKKLLEWRDDLVLAEPPDGKAAVPIPHRGSVLLSAASVRAVLDYTPGEWDALTNTRRVEAEIRYEKIMDSLRWVERYIDHYAPAHIRVALNTGDYEAYSLACWVAADFFVKAGITLYADIPQHKPLARRRREAREYYNLCIKRDIPPKKAIGLIHKHFGYDRKSVRKWVSSEEPPVEEPNETSSPKPLKRGENVPHNERKVNRFAWRIARKWAPIADLPAQELHGIAMVEGMAKATRSYDPARGAFESFAYTCMESEVKDYIRKIRPKIKAATISNTDVVEGIEGSPSYAIPASGRGATGDDE